MCEDEDDSCFSDSSLTTSSSCEHCYTEEPDPGKVYIYEKKWLDFVVYYAARDDSPGYNIKLPRFYRTYFSGVL